MSVSRQKEPFKMEVWCQKELSKLLKFSVGDELVCYLLSMETAKDIDEYLTELLGADNPGGQKFKKEFLSHWHPPQRIPSPLTPQEGQILEELMRPQQEDMVLFQGEGGGGKSGGSAKGGRAKGQKKDPSSGPPPGFTMATETTSKMTPTLWNKSTTSASINPPPGLSSLPGSATRQSQGQVKKQKFVPLMSKEGQSRIAMHVPGRHACQCLAQKHDLINNCVECGRIICSQEGPGPCIFCGSLVFSPEEEKMLARDSKKAQKIKEKIIKQFQLKEGERVFDHFRKEQMSHGLEKAMEHRDKLLEFDQTSAQRTHVLDDERDFFAVDTTSWTSAEEKEALQQREKELREKKFGSRWNKAFTLDIAGRKVVEEQPQIEIYDEANVRDLKEKMKKKAAPTATHDSISKPIQHPKFEFVENDSGVKRRERRGGGVLSRGIESVPLVTRLQDRELQEMRDEGKCLSMHQPWATLLVEGVKRVEGRTWYTTHRGRLWIAAAAKVPSPEEIEEQHTFYRTLYGEDVMFPCDYPTGCLLGYVDLTDCLSQEEYREKYPNGESTSPYVFLCENPQQLIVKFPIKGNHKIWRLPKDIHCSAKAAFHQSIHSL